MKKVKKLYWKYTSREDLACDVRDIPEIVVKLNEVIDCFNKLSQRQAKRPKTGKGE